MKVLLVIMTGIGFTLGVVLGLLLHLPSDSLPAEHNSPFASSTRHRRSVDHLDLHLPSGQTSALDASSDTYEVVAPIRFSNNEREESKFEGRVDKAIKGRNETSSGGGVQRSRQEFKQNINNHGEKSDRVFDEELAIKQTQETHSLSESFIPNTVKNDEIKGGDRHEASKTHSQSVEDDLYLKSLVRGVLWTDKLEQSCPRAFKSSETESWRRKAESLDVVKMEEGCGRMQNRLLTFRDASKACARYRLNTDQIQGEIFSYYLSKLLNISNLPPTSLALVNSVDKKWRTVHLDLSLAQWADSKLVVLTQYIHGLEAAHIPQDFREDHRQLHPILSHLGTKSRAELCELVQWSDLIVFDYLTANLDRVINNMFNRQWNDQIMESPAHNLEKFKDGSLVFLDNESGLFHGFRLIDKYESLHRALLDSLCIFRSSTANAIKRLASSGSVGAELRALLQENEPLHRRLANLPQKNLKILQKRIEQVNEQISKCEKMFNR